MKFDASDVLIFVGMAGIAGGTWLISGATCLITVGTLLLVGGVVGEVRRLRGSGTQK